MSQYPLVLSHPQIRRIAERKAQALILTRQLPIGMIEIRDALTEQRNQRARKRGRVDLQEDPHAFMIEVSDRDAVPLMELTLITVRSAGYKTTEDFYLDWLERRRRVDVTLIVHVHRFRIVESPRFLHVRVHRGYTSDPGQAAFGEPEALSNDDVDRLSRARPRESDEWFLKRARRNIAVRAKEAALRGDVATYNALSAELALVAGGTASAGVHPA